MHAGEPSRPRCHDHTEILSMKIGFICPNLPGHLNPLSALARHLQARNHEVVFLYSSGAVGLPFIPGPEKDQFRENLPEVSKLHGDDAVKFSLLCRIGSDPIGRAVHPGGSCRSFRLLWLHSPLHIWLASSKYPCGSSEKSGRC
jgi:hypothetical protein